MGVSNFQGISYNLAELLTNQDLSSLDESFSIDEIEMTIKALPNSHAPGPDALMGSSLKNAGVQSKKTSLYCFMSSIMIILIYAVSIPQSLL